MKIGNDFVRDINKDLVHHLWARENPLRPDRTEEVIGEQTLDTLMDFEDKHAISVLPDLKDRFAAGEVLQSLMAAIRVGAGESKSPAIIRLLKSRHFIDAIMNPEAEGLHIFIARACAIHPTLIDSPITNFLPYKEESAALDKMVEGLYAKYDPAKLREKRFKAITLFSPIEEFAGDMSEEQYSQLIDALHDQVISYSNEDPQENSADKSVAIMALMQSEFFFRAYKIAMQVAGINENMAIKTGAEFMGGRYFFAESVESFAKMIQVEYESSGSEDEKRASLSIDAHEILTKWRPPTKYLRPKA